MRTRSTPASAGLPQGKLRDFLWPMSTLKDYEVEELSGFDLIDLFPGLMGLEDAAIDVVRNPETEEASGRDSERGMSEAIILPDVEFDELSGCELGEIIPSFPLRETPGAGQLGDDWRRSPQLAAFAVG